MALTGEASRKCKASEPNNRTQLLPLQVQCEMRLVTGVLLIASLGAASAAICDVTGLEAPDVVTMTSTKGFPAPNVVILRPDCTYYAVEQANRGGMYYITSTTVERIASVPNNAATL
jgi:hypothetical protein